MPDSRLALPAEITRNNYFTSQFLVEADFTNEQAYQRAMRYLNNRALYVWGVVDGLKVTKTGPLEVTVEPGMAIDKDGREIVLPTQQKLALNPTKPGYLFIVILYSEDAQNQKYAYTITGLTDTKYTRTIERWQLEARETASAPDDGSVIKLGRMIVDQNKQTRDTVDNSVRRLAGSSIRRGGGSGDLFIAADGKVGIGTTSPGQNLEVAGALKLSTNPIVTNDQVAAYFWNQNNVGPTIAGGNFEVRTGGDTPRLRIDSRGNVGIGTGVSDPAARLHVGSGALQVGTVGDFITFIDSSITHKFASELNPRYTINRDLLGSGNAGIGFGAVNASIQAGGSAVGLPTSKTLAFYTSDGSNLAERVRINSSGSVGIGTQTPGFPLSFPNSAGDKIALWGQSGNHYGFGIQSGLLQIHTDVVGSDIAFGYGTSGAFTETMRIKGNGRVGIGTSALGESKLKIANSATDFVDVRFSGTDTGMGHLEIVGWSAGWSINTRTDEKHLCLNREAGAKSNVFIGRSGKQLLVRGSDGYVGIGTVNPRRPLQIGENMTGIGFELSEGSPNAGYIRFGDNTGWKLHFGQSMSGGTLLEGRWGIIMTLEDRGNLGIGTTSPGGKLELQSEATKVKFGGIGGDVHHLSSKRDIVFNSEAGVFYFRSVTSYDDLATFTELMKVNPNGDVAVKGVVTRSSREFKENISDLTAREAIATLQNLTPVKYYYKDEKTFRPKLGFIAEEMPDNLASEDRKSISPFEVIPVLTRVAKEQQQTIAALQEDIRALQAKMRRRG